MNCSKFLFLLMLQWWCYEGAIAQPITSDEAAQVVRDFLNNPNASTRHQSQKIGQQELKLTHIARNGSTTCYYVFDVGEDDGYVLASADERAEGILGFSDKGKFNFDSIPCCMKAWLEGYEEQIKWAVTNQRSIASSPRKAKANISPLIKSKWNQWSPYNDKCPAFTSTFRCVTGCVATATAQIMFYYKYPNKGSGKHSYTDEIKGKKVKLTADFGSTSYQWAKMTNTYADNSGSSAKTAVATLMSHIGVATDMDYAFGGINASATSLDKAKEALTTYFGYDKGMMRFLQDYSLFNSTQWEDCIYSELQQKRPVLYEGNPKKGNDSGHAFIIDGYKNGKYHFNFGWGGSGDGYFALNAVKPTDANKTYDFSTLQGMVIGIQKPVAVANVTADIKQYGNLTTPRCIYSRLSSDNVRLNIDEGKGFFYNQGNGLATVQMGLKLENKETGTISYVAAKTPNSDDAGYFEQRLWDSFLQIDIPVGNFIQNGQFTATPVYRLKDSGEWKAVSVVNGSVDRADIVVNDFSIQISTLASNVEVIEATFTDMPKRVIFGEKFSVTVSLTNRGKVDSRSWYTLCAVKEGTTKMVNTGYRNYSCQIQPGESESITIEGTIKGNDDMTYRLCLRNRDDNVVAVSEPFVATSTYSFEMSAPLILTQISQNQISFTSSFKSERKQCYQNLKAEVVNADGAIVAEKEQSFYVGDEEESLLEMSLDAQFDAGIIYTLRLLKETNSGEYHLIVPSEWNSSSFVINDANAIIDVNSNLQNLVSIKQGVIYISKLSAGQSFRIYNMRGQLIHHTISQGLPVKYDCNLLPKGIYFLQVGKQKMKVCFAN